MTAVNVTPPRGAIRLIEWRFSAEDAEAIIGDLTEEFDARRAKNGGGSARRWFWRQAVGSLLSRRQHAVADAAPGGSP